MWISLHVYIAGSLMWPSTCKTTLVIILVHVERTNAYAMCKIHDIFYRENLISPRETFNMSHRYKSQKSSVFVILLFT